MSGDTVSVQRTFAGAKVFLTGATGYVGSVVLEQLLRCTQVDTVYCLLRPKRDQEPDERLQKVLHSTLFHKVRDTPAIKRARAIEGDIMMGGLGLTAADRSKLENEVNVILHCAADITLDADIQVTLRANVEGLRSIIALARACTQLRGMVHVSSAYVNMNMPAGSTVDEAIYPLMHGGLVQDAEHIVQELLLMDKDAANKRVRAYLGRFNFPNTYTFGKNLGEKILAAAHAESPLPVAIVRPSLICCVALEPLPGYCGNLAGPNGICAALATGLYDSLDAVPFHPHHTWDIMAADYVGHTILAAAAAEAAATAARQGTVLAAAAGGQVAPVVPLPVSRRAAGGKGPFHRAFVSGQATPEVGSENSSPCYSDAGHGSGPPSAGTASLEEAPGAASPPLKIYHASLGSNAFVTFQEGWSYWRAFVEEHPPPWRMTWGLPGDIPNDFKPDPLAVVARVRWTRIKAAVLALLLDWFGLSAAAKSLRNGVTSFAVLNNSQLDRNLTFMTTNVVNLASRLPEEEAATFPLVWKAMGTARTPAGELCKVRDPRREKELAMTPKAYGYLMMRGVYYKLFRIKIESE